MPTLTENQLSRKGANKSQEAYERLTALAQKLGPSAKLPKVTELRRDLQVSITTLDSVLTQLEHQNIIFRKQGSGIYVSPQLRQICVGLVCEPAFFQAGTSPFWSQLVEAARLRALESGELFRFYMAMPFGDLDVPVHSDLVEDVRAKRIQGVIFVGNNHAALQWLEKNGVPAVVFAGRARYLVEIDGPMLVRQALDHVLERGAQRPALLVPWDVAVEPSERHFYSPEGREFRDHLQRRGLPCDPGLVWETRAMGSEVDSIPATRQGQGIQAVETLLSRKGDQPDALISMDDMMTRGVLTGLRRLGRTPGRDILVVSHTNKGSTVLLGEEGVAFVEVDPAEVVRTLFSQLEYLMNGQVPPHPWALVPARILDSSA